MCDAAHKVGESTVEIGAHYFEHVLGLQQHLAESQLRKFGFRFFFSEGARDLGGVTELGASRALAVTSWQLDRGILENFLAEEAARRGVRFVDGATVRSIALAGGETAESRSGEPPAAADATAPLLTIDWQLAGDAATRFNYRRAGSSTTAPRRLLKSQLAWRAQRPQRSTRCGCASARG